MLQSVPLPLQVPREPLCSLYVTQSINIGLKDSVNPYALSAVVIFIFLLYLVKKDRLPINTFSRFFIIGYVVSVLGLIFGLFEDLLNNFLFTRIIQIANLVVGVFFVVIGLRHLKGWWQLKKNNAFNQLVVKALLFFSDETVEGKQLRWVRRNTLRMGSLCWGMLAAFLGAGWGPDKDLYVMFGFLNKGNNLGKGLWGIVLYSIIQAWIFFMIWIVFAMIKRSESSQLWVEKNISLIKIAAAALFLSVGIGITYLSIK